ncbi:recombination regulator RecX [Alkalibacterium sp. MB6]|uniref:recombination regulator RecX n=1 Tax=Alkalibacterium sp. MB6 TaxID=2081965 RepID=UPI001379E45E|nr:recombination regulator RecX [Alkalibacterium sp. MB6]
MVNDYVNDFNEENNSSIPGLIELSPNTVDKGTEKKEIKTNDEPSSLTSNKNGWEEDLLNQYRSENKKKENKLIITKIQAQKAKGRYNIFVNDEYAFAVDDNLLVNYRLMKGMELTKEVIEELREKGEMSKAYQAALNYLNFKMRTEKEVRDHLKKKEYQSVDSVIEKLKNHRFINDREYAISFVRTNYILKNDGPRKIEQALYKKGINKNDILEGLEEYKMDQQKENALALAEKTLNRQRNKSSREVIQKVREQLMLNGFSSEIISEVMEEIDTEQSVDEEYESLEKQGEKAWTRYSRKSKNRDLIQKTKAFLYSKGYPKELIERFITEKEEDM